MRKVRIIFLIKLIIGFRYLYRYCELNNYINFNCFILKNKFAYFIRNRVYFANKNNIDIKNYITNVNKAV